MTTKSASRLTLRLPRPLKVWIEQQAKANDRSLNTEIMFHLEMARLGVQHSRPVLGGQPVVGEASQA
jgi:hypothetical protein